MPEPISHGGPLSIWTVYDTPSDRPAALGHLRYVARRFEIRSGIEEPVPTDDTIQATDLDMVRRAMCLRGLTCLPRSEDDEAHIVECWL